MSFMIETSARHIHLTQESVEKLFGEGYQLTVRKPLSYPGQYASNERLTIVGPKKEMANVSILGPTRKADQVEISAGALTPAVMRAAEIYLKAVQKSRNRQMRKE